MPVLVISSGQGISLKDKTEHLMRGKTNMRPVVETGPVLRGRGTKGLLEIYQLKRLTP